MQSIPVISYTRLVKLAEGFFAEVFKVTDSDMVIKIPKSGASHLHDIEKRIYERIGDHQGILPYYGEWQITEASGKVRLGLCFAYEPGGTLRELLLERDTHPLLEHLITFGPSQLATALSHIHARGIIHGDIGTHNILVGSAGTLRLCDFGGSRIDGSKCFAFPSARYRRLAQNIDTRDSYDPGPKDDIFALGMVIFEVMTGQNLWQDMSHDEVLDLIASQKWPELEPGATDEGLMEVVKNCWNGIYESADEISTQLGVTI